MFERDDPFTGTWRFDAQRSKLTTPFPRSWVQHIIATSDEVQVHENIVRPDGSETVVEVRARFDSRDYPVSGSPAVDATAYTRVNSRSISGIGRKGGAIALTETATVENNILTLTYSIHSGDRVVATGVAVFEKKFD